MRVTEAELEKLAADLFRQWKLGDIVLLDGPLGAGKTTFARGVLRAAGHVEPVRSPSFSLIQTYPTNPPILHADFYRLTGMAEGLDLAELLDEHLSLIEWPGQVDWDWPAAMTWRVHLQFVEGSDHLRELTLVEPAV